MIFGAGALAVFAIVWLQTLVREAALPIGIAAGVLIALPLAGVALTPRAGRGDS